MERLELFNFLIAALFAGCSKTCKESGCKKEVYKKGYCKLHYAEHYPLEAIGDLGEKALDGLGKLLK